MSSIIKVNTVQDTDGNNIINENANTITIGASGDTISIPSGATLANNGTATGFASIAWQSSVKTATFTAVAGEGYFINTTGGAFEVDLPTSPSVGDQIVFTDFARKFATNALTLDQGSNKFQGNVASTKKPEYNTSGQTIQIVYSGSTQGWIPTSDDDVAFVTQPTYTANFLVIAGGASGGSRKSGGGGAGGYRASYNSEASGGGGSSETALQLSSGEVYTVTVGAGGAAVSNTPAGAGNDGSASSISGTGITTVSCVGGGGGNGDVSPNSDGRDGGCGGGAGGNGGPVSSGGSGTANQGYDGGGGYAGSHAAGGGGGGAGAVGASVPGNQQPGGAGGTGVASTITGSSVTRAGGGGGINESPSYSAGAGGTGGGGGGGIGGGTAGTTNTGSGGGGVGSSGTSGAGGSGVVILRMATANYSGTTSGSPTVSNDGSDTIITFNASGSYTG